MTYRIARQFRFSASHQLDGLAASHKCARLHGHNYLVSVEITAEKVNEIGMVMEFGLLDGFDQLLKRGVDHRHLNEIMEVNPTAENVARWLYDHAVNIVGAHLGEPEVTVRVSENDHTWAEYRP